MSDIYKVSVYSSPLPLPFSCFVHSYIVTENAKNINRYDVIVPGMLKNIPSYDGRIFKNILPAETGFLIIFRRYPEKSKGKRWNTKLQSICSGTIESPACKLYNFIESEGLHGYSNKNNYNAVLGPNSNTFVQWVINQVPECKLTLPRNAWGKGYKE